MSDTQTTQAATARATEGAAPPSPGPSAQPAPQAEKTPEQGPPSRAVPEAPTSQVATPTAAEKGAAQAAAPAEPQTSQAEKTPEQRTQSASPKEPEKPGNAAPTTKEDEFRKLILQLGDLSGDLEDKVLAARINRLVSMIDVPGRNDQPSYRTAIAYALQDAEKDGMTVRVFGSMRAELGQLAATYPGLQNVRLQELVASTPDIEDKAVVKAIRTAAAEVAGQSDQQAASTVSRIDALANRIRLGTEPAETTSAQPRTDTQAARAVTAPALDVAGLPEQVVAAAAAPNATNGSQPGRTVLDIMNALRRPEPEGSPSWDKQLTPMGDRITAYGARMQSNSEERDMKRAERTGAAALTAMKEFADGPGAVLMTRIRDAAKADPEGMSGVLAEMRDGGRYAGLRQDLTVSLQHEKFAAAYDRALSGVTAFGAERAEIDKLSGQRPDAAAVAGRFQKLDAEVGKAASELPSRTDGKSFVDELAERTQEIVAKAVEVVTNAFNRLRSASASPSPGPS